MVSFDTKYFFCTGEDIEYLKPLMLFVVEKKGFQPIQIFCTIFLCTTSYFTNNKLSFIDFTFFIKKKN